MLPDELITTVETLKQRMADHGAILHDNETRTRMALIDPLLHALGWDTTDPFLVIPEFVIGGGQVDYALLGKKGGPTAVIEAKHFEEPLHRHRDKVIGYTKNARVQYAAITNGDHWELYDVSGSGSLEEKQILDVRVSASPSHQSALNLLLLWRPNLTSEQPVRTENAAAIVPPAPGPSPWTSLAKFSFHKGKRCPKTIRFLDRTEYPVHHWYDLALRTAQWLWSNRLLTEDDFSDFSSELRHLVHTEKIHPSGKEFFNPKPVPDTCLILEANMSGDTSLKKTRELLEVCGQSPAFVQLEQ